MKNKVKIKRLLSENYGIECIDSDGVIMNGINEYLAEKEIGGLDKIGNNIAVFHSNKVLRGVVNCCMFNGINFSVEFD